MGDTDEAAVWAAQKEKKLESVTVLDTYEIRNAPVTGAARFRSDRLKPLRCPREPFASAQARATDLYFGGHISPK